MSSATTIPAAAPSADDFRWPRWWRMVLLAICTLLLCSCSAMPPDARQLGPGDSIDPALVGSPTATPPGAPCGPQCADGGDPALMAAGNPWMDQALPYNAMGPWAPPGLPLPWPQDEYLRDGGDREYATTVDRDWDVRGLDLEDTVAHFDTLDGRRLVEPSNVVNIYAPRFGSVRSITGPNLNEQVDGPARFSLPVRLVQQEEVQIPSTKLQNEQLVRQAGVRQQQIYRGRQWNGGLSTAIPLAAFQDAFLPYENISIIRKGILQQSEKAYLAIGVTAAITWTSDQAVQVVLDRASANEVVGDRRAQATYTTETLPGCPMLRIVKVASTQFANPGDTVDFTLRFDNVGTETIGNVTILDNLTTRLEYVPDTAQASLPAEFFTEVNQGDSLVLRWEVNNPLRPGEGGICRFRCRVR